MNGISVSARVRRKLASSLCSLPCEGTLGSQQCVSGRRLSPDLERADTLILDLQSQEL